MEQLVITIPEELKKQFQIKTIMNNTSMTAVLVKAIKQYVEEK